MTHKDGPPAPATLPRRTAAELTLRQAAALTSPRDSRERQAFHRYVKALRDAGWSLADLAAPLGVTRETVRRASMRTDGGGPPLDVPRKQKQQRTQPRTTATPHLTSAEIRQMKRLAPLAAKVRGFTPVDSPNRRAAARFVEMLVAARERGVQPITIEREIGVPRNTIRLRLARWGKVPTPPSVQPYQNNPSTMGPRDQCRRGHALNEDTTYVVRRASGTVRVCRQCHAIRRATYLARKAATQSD